MIDEFLEILKQSKTDLVDEILYFRKHVTNLYQSISIRNTVIFDQKEIIKTQHLIILNLEKQLEKKNGKLYGQKNTSRRYRVRLRVRGKSL